MPPARFPMQSSVPRTELAACEIERWQVSDGVMFSILTSAVLWSLIVVGVHATLT